MKKAVANARELPRKPILLQAIYLAHNKVVASFDTVKDTEQQKETLHEEACVCDTNMASLNAELQQKEDQVPDRVFMHTHSCPQLKLYHVRCPGCQLQNGATSHSFLYSGRDLRDKYFNKKKHRINGEEDGSNARSNTKRYIISCQCWETGDPCTYNYAAPCTCIQTHTDTRVHIPSINKNLSEPSTWPVSSS